MKKRLNGGGISQPKAAVLVLLFSCSLFLTLNAVDYNTVVEKEVVSRDTKLDAVVGPMMSEAIALRDAGKYKEAIQKCDAALTKIQTMNLGDGPFVVAQKSMLFQLKDDIRKKWGAIMLAEARRLLQLGDRQAKKKPEESNATIQKAVELARVCRREVPGTVDYVDPIISMGEKILKSNKFVQETSLGTIDPDNASRKQQIAIHLREAQIFYKTRQFAKARDILEQVLVLDPYNDKAVFELKKIYKKLYSIAEMRRENEVLERMNEIEWKWNNSILPRGDQIVEERGPQEASQEGKMKMYEKLQSIIIPEIDFGGVNVSSIVTQLKRRSKELDPEKRGINIIYSSEINPEVTLQFSDIPLGEVIRYLCQYAKLKYKVEENAVRIGSAKDIDDMDTRVFKMRTALYNRLTETNTTKKKKEKTTSSGDRMEIFGNSKDNNPFAEGASREKSEDGGGLQGVSGVDSETLKKYFEIRGIPFEQGSSISFDSRSSKLFVKNTPENLRKLDSLLREIDIVTPLVLIESKILEISVTDLEELGFDWTLTKSNSNPGWISGIFDSNTSAFSNTPLIQSLTRHYSSEGSWTSSASDTTGALINKLNIMPNFGPDGAYNVFLTVNAIDQNERGEILSAPKIIATSGLEATVKFAKEMYFPDTWSEPEVTSNGNTYEYTPPYPEFGDARDIGIIFTVLPHVSPNNHTITLKIKPQVSSLTGWTTYEYDILIGDISGVGNGVVETRRPMVKMSEIALREIETNVKVYDGETVVLGGILNDEVSQVDDKYPFLGDIPLLGRLFSSQGTISQKKNLMIFVTTRIMNLDGVPVKSKMDNGLFDFNR